MCFDNFKNEEVRAFVHEGLIFIGRIEEKDGDKLAAEKKGCWEENRQGYCTLGEKNIC